MPPTVTKSVGAAWPRPTPNRPGPQATLTGRRLRRAIDAARQRHCAYGAGELQRATSDTAVRMRLPWPEFIHGTPHTTLVATHVSWEDRAAGGRVEIFKVSWGADPVKRLRLDIVTRTREAIRATLLAGIAALGPLDALAPSVIASAYETRPDRVAARIVLVPASYRQIWELRDLDESCVEPTAIHRSRYEYVCTLAAEWCAATSSGRIALRLLSDPPDLQPTSRRIHSTTVFAAPRPRPRRSGIHRSVKSTDLPATVGAAGQQTTPGCVGVADLCADVTTLLPATQGRLVPSHASDWLSRMERRGLHLPGV